MVLLASRSIGNAGTMEIHDNDGYVSMWVRSSDSATHNTTLPWRAIINGGWTPNGSGAFGTVNYPSGSPWVTVGVWWLGTSQQVMFEIGNSGTWGLGGGGQLYANVSRATVPPPPSNIGLDQITQTSMRYRFSSAGDGGSPVDEWQIVRAKDANFTQEVVFISSSGTSVITGLTPGTRYWFAARGHNALGWGGYSAALNEATLPSGARVGKGGAFVTAETFVGKGTAFVTPQILVGKGGIFVPPA